MTLGLSADIRGQIGDFELTAQFRAEVGVTAFFGESGSGKTTILRAISGLWTPQAGKITLGGVTLFDQSASISIPANQRQIAFVQQRPLLFPHMSVKQNLLYSENSDLDKLDDLVERFDLAPLLERKPQSLSGGEAQRVALGRALISEPKLLLLDEPLTGLDERRRENVLPYIEQMCADTAIPIIYVSHHRSEIERIANHIAIVQSGQISAVMTTQQFKKTS